ncbi:DUF1569 domain-containing protein [Streptomyces sp. FxanaA7]|uniref:DUF1569 domain-containing protein n=1 Tax=Streptomyces sp. FxanaA7 TaxID=1265492 RepID=UPI002D21A752|nr:DUF1569 domain-containing protein [Streptomyces sp. FxanaA7]
MGTRSTRAPCDRRAVTLGRRSRRRSPPVDSSRRSLFRRRSAADCSWAQRPDGAPIFTKRTHVTEHLEIRTASGTFDAIAAGPADGRPVLFLHGVGVPAPRNDEASARCGDRPSAVAGPAPADGRGRGRLRRRGGPVHRRRGRTRPHPAYGRCTHDEFARLRAIHLAEHLPGPGTA